MLETLAWHAEHAVTMIAVVLIWVVIVAAGIGILCVLLVGAVVYGHLLFDRVFGMCGDCKNYIREEERRADRVIREHDEEEARWRESDRRKVGSHIGSYPGSVTV